MKGQEKFESNTYYHIVNHAVGNENLFRTDDNYRYFLKRYAFYMPKVWSTLAYCLMPNHIHFLIKTHTEKELLLLKPKYDIHKIIMQQLSNLLNSYAKAYNKRYERKGALWIDFTKRFKIKSNSYLTSTIMYIHQNPVNHGFVKHPADWYFSSFHAVDSTKPTHISRETVIEWFGGIDKFKEYHEEHKADLLENWE